MDLQENKNKNSFESKSYSTDQANAKTGEQDFFIRAPTISLPKGGGALKGIDKVYVFLLQQVFAISLPQCPADDLVGVVTNELPE